jgi:hypothetical protein
VTAHGWDSGAVAYGSVAVAISATASIAIAVSAAA